MYLPEPVGTSLCELIHLPSHFTVSHFLKKQSSGIYDRAFKEKAVQLSKDRKNISELARELGITAPQLYKWRKELETYGTGSFPGNGNLKQTPEQEHIAALEKKLKESSFFGPHYQVFPGREACPEGSLLRRSRREERWDHITNP